MDSGATGTTLSPVIVAVAETRSDIESGPRLELELELEKYACTPMSVSSELEYDSPEERVGECCFCGDPCNPASQACGACPRLLFSM